LPYEGNSVGVYDGSNWVIRPVPDAGFSVASSTGSQDLPHDVFVYPSGSTLAIELLAWTNATTRATAITTQDGVEVKSGDATRRLAGTVYIRSASKYFDDSGTGGAAASRPARRHVCNKYNRIPREFHIIDDTDTWALARASFASLNGDTDNRVSFVDTDGIQPVYCRHQMGMRPSSTSGFAYPNIGFDSTTAGDAQIKSGSGGLTGTAFFVAESAYLERTAVGYHYLQLTERTASAVSVTIWGDGGLSYLQFGGIGWISG
jgi:hypothetical protein